MAGFGVDNWQGLLGPARLPRNIAVALDRELAAMAGSRDFVELVNTQGVKARHGGGTDGDSLKALAYVGLIVLVAGLRVCAH